MNKNMKLKKGDVLYYQNGKNFNSICINDWDGLTIKEVESRVKNIVVTSVERLQTIYEFKEILDEKEREYLSEVIKPFKSRIVYIVKESFGAEFISIVLSGITGIKEYVTLPFFKKGTMYKGMKCCKKYTLKELGLD